MFSHLIITFYVRFVFLRCISICMYVNIKRSTRLVTIFLKNSGDLILDILFLIFLPYILLSLLYFKNRHWEIEYKTNYKNDISFQLEIKTSRIIILVNEVISHYSFMNQNDWSFQSTIHVQYSSVIKNMSIFFKFSNECVCLKGNFIPI